MKKNNFLIRHVCKPYCVYYKPGKNEGFLCRGAEVALRFLGRSDGPSDRRPVHQSQSLSDARKAAQELCRKCNFREHDCDFAQDQTAQPCGGYLYIVELLAEGAITNEQISRES